MSGWTDAEVMAALVTAERVGPRGGPGRDPGGWDDLRYGGVTTDTRSAGPETLFVALAGENFDGHDFLAAAAEAGCRGAVVSRVPAGAPDMVYYRVPDTLVALGRLGRFRRRKLDARVCAITGTNGKTSTKDMMRAVLGTRYAVHATSANLNNLVGGPLTLLSAPDDAGAVVVEIGTNAPGEIARLADIVEAEVGVITAVAAGHLEGFGSVEGVLREKTTLLSRLRPGGVALVAEEPRSLVERARSLVREVRVAGWTEGADAALRAEDVRVVEDGRVRFDWQGREITLPFGGRVHARNALLALGVGLEWGVDPDLAVAALAEMNGPSMRGELLRYDTLTVIADCYNANPASLEAAVDTLVSMPRRGGRVVVVGTMKELGAQSEALHRESARAMAEADVDLIVATGEFVAAFEGLESRLADRLIRADEPERAFELMAERLSGDEVVLLKASRGVALERLLPRLEEWVGTRRNGTGG